MGIPPHRHRHLPPPVEETSVLLRDGRYSETPIVCPNCRWAQVSPGGWKCRRWPPVVNQSRPGEALFPIMQADDWCGEFSQ